MNTDLGRPSPLDELRDRSSYFPDLSLYDDTKSENTFQDESQYQAYMTTNRSLLSFETVQTNERLLDKLDLSAEDEALLQQALKEEEESNRVHEMRQYSGPIICMPASQFPSLRTKTPLASRELDVKIGKLSLQSLNLRGDVSSSAVEQHHAAKFRYSYLAEEDSDSNSSESKNTVEPGEASRSHVSEQRDLESPSNGNVNVVNFENYRVENSKLAHYYPHLFRDAKIKRQPTLQVTGIPAESNEISGDRTTPLKNDNLYQNRSGNSTTTSFVEVGQLSKPKTQSSMESIASSNSYSRMKGGAHSVYISTPTKGSSSPTIDASFIREISKEPVPPYKAHKKKSSFSFKNLFKSPKTAKSKTSPEPRSSFEDNQQSHAHLNSSGETSPKKRSKQLRRFIFPANPVLHFEPMTPQKSTKPSKRKQHHFRSLSDFHRTSPPIENHSGKKLDGQDSSQHTYKPRRRLSLDSRRPDTSASYNTSAASRNLGKNHLQFYNDEPEETFPAAGSAPNKCSNSSNQIEMAIHMRNEGRLKESARRLQNACLTKDKTAFLLYGLALRHGCGVPKDYKESFNYIRAATGIQSEIKEVFEVETDPFLLEKNHTIPEVVPEPVAPALYECGMAYLKGYGFDREDEMKGLKYLERAAAMGHIDSMCLCGTIWSKKSSVRKRDISRAAAWFRLAERQGANLIGSQWIHKQKYMRKPSLSAPANVAEPNHT